MKRVTSIDVAKAAGVSRTTVSLVLNESPGANISAATRSRVVDTARALGYVPDANARRLVTGTTNTLALAIHKPAAHAFADAYLSNTLSGIARKAKEHGFRIALELTDQPSDISNLHNLLRSGAVDGLICEDWMTEAALREAGFVPTDPLILLSERVINDFSHVCINLVDAQRMIIAQALKAGHRNFACITYTQSGNSISQDRRLLDLKSQLNSGGACLVADGVESGDLTVAGAEAAMRAILDRSPSPTVVFGMNDTMAIGALLALQKAGIRVPDEVSVIGFEGQEVTRLVSPAISTVEIPWLLKGEVAANALIEMLSNPECGPQRHVLPAQLLLQDSLSEITDGLLLP